MAQVIVDLTGDASRLQKAYDVAEKSDKSLRDSLAGTGKVGQSSAEKIGREFDQAGDKSSKAFNLMIRELRKAGPEGRQVAGEVEKHLRETGKAGRKSMDSIISRLSDLDPEAASAANAMRKHLSEGAESVDTKFGEVEKSGAKAFGAGLVTKLGVAAGGFFSVGEAIQQVNMFLRDQEELLDQAAEGHISLAQAQQEASKNLGALTPAQRAQFLQVDVGKIAQETGFGDLGQISIAGGVAASRGLADPKKIAEAVSAAARIERLTPENLDETTSGAVAIQRQTGLASPEQAIALLQTTGTQAAVTDVAALVKSMPGALGSSVSTVRGQEVQEASRQAASLFAQITQGGNDERGESSATFQIDLSNRLGSFFSNLESQRVEARSELVALERKDKPLERDVVRMQELKRLIPSLEGMQDPGTLFGRIEALQGAPAVRDQFVGKGFGEQRFQVVLGDLFDATSDTAKGLRQSFEIIKADRAFYDREVRAMERGTPQLALATAAAKAEAARKAQDAFDTPAAALSNIREITSEALAKTSPGMIRGMLEQGFTVPGLGIPIGDVGIERGSLGGSDALGEGISAIIRLGERKNALVYGGVDSSEKRKIQTIDAALQAITGQVTDQIQTGVFDPKALSRSARSARISARQVEDSVQQYGTPELAAEQRATREILERLAETMDRQLQANERTADNTGKPAISAASDVPNYSYGLQSAANQAAMP